MTGMNWDRANRENRAMSEADRVFDPEPTAPVRRKMRRAKKRPAKKRKKMTEKERALAWHRQNRVDSLGDKRHSKT